MSAAVLSLVQRNARAASPGRPVRVCFLIDELAKAGTETQLLALIRQLDRRRVMPSLCLLRGESESSRALEPAECPVLRLGAKSLHGLRAVGAAWKLGRFLRQERIDVLQTYFPDSTYMGVPVARLAGVPCVVRTRNNLGHWLTPVHRVLGRLLNPLTSATVANCEAAREALLEAERPRPASVFVLENGVDCERFASVPPLANGPLRRVGIVANLRQVKGLDVFLAAAARVASRHPDASFAIAGEGPEREALQRQAVALGIKDRVRFVGSIDNVPAFLGSIDVAVLASRAEGMSNAVLEYMAAGRAIVATDVGANGRLLRDGVDGLLVRSEDNEEMSGTIVRLLSNGALARQMGASARQRVQEKFSRAAMVRRFEDFYEWLFLRSVAA